MPHAHRQRPGRRLAAERARPVVGFLPRLVGFLVILLIGWLIARVVKALLVKALQAVGIDRALNSGAAGPHVARAMPDARPSEVIGTIAFWFLFLGAFAIAVSQLGILALNNFVQSIVAYLPNVVVAILIFALLGSVALGMAIAFGLGGRDVAARMLEEAYRSGRERREEARRFRRDSDLRPQAPTARS